jgi:hypothetical protein
MALPRAALDKVYQVLIQYTIMISSANDINQAEILVKQKLDRHWAVTKLVTTDVYVQSELNRIRCLVNQIQFWRDKQTSNMTINANLYNRVISQDKIISLDYFGLGDSSVIRVILIKYLILQLEIPYVNYTNRCANLVDEAADSNGILTHILGEIDPLQPYLNLLDAAKLLEIRSAINSAAAHHRLNQASATAISVRI